MGDPVTTLTKNEEAYSPAIAGAIANAEAWIKAACAMAVKFPRDIDRVRENLLRECKRPDFARGRFNPKNHKWEGGARYSKPIGGSEVKGFSVRFAEAAIQCMGHIHTTCQTLAETDEFRKISVRVWDAVSMNSYDDEATIQKTIERRSVPQGQEVLRTRVGASGQLLYIIRAEEGDLLNTVNAAKSKSIRNSGLRHVPGWLLAECERVIAETVSTEDARDPEATKREIFDAFSALGVTVDQLKKYIGHDVVKLEPKELADLRELYAGIRDGETTMKAIFEQREEADKEKNGKAASVRDKILDKGKKDPEACISKEQAAALDQKAADSGYKPIEWAQTLRDNYGVAVTDKIPASKFNEAMKLASGA